MIVKVEYAQVKAGHVIRRPGGLQGSTTYSLDGSEGWDVRLDTSTGLVYARGNGVGTYVLAPDQFQRLQISEGDNGPTVLRTLFEDAEPTPAGPVKAEPKVKK
jgi:hypothetical protein